MLLTTIAALGAALLFATSNALRHRSARDTPLVGSLRSADLARFSWSTIQHPIWLLGALADLGGIGFHAVALHSGPLTVVQPLQVSALLFALPLRRLLDRRRPALGELGWAAALALGLITFLLVATPAAAKTSPADHLPAIITAILIGVAIVAFTLGGRRSHGTLGAAGLGAAAGLAAAATAALLKTTTDVLAHHPGQLLTSWPVYSLVAIGIAGLLLNQLAFQAGPLRASLPAITTVDPVASLVIGVGVYDEHLRGGLAAVGIETLAMALVIVASVCLCRSGLAEETQTPRLAPNAEETAS